MADYSMTYLLQLPFRVNLSRVPWWGGQFEQMVGTVKKSLYKAIVKIILTWSKFEEVLLDVGIVLNNRPLSYVEDDVEMPIRRQNHSYTNLA